MLSGQVFDLTEIQPLSNLQQLALAFGSKLHGLKVYIEPISHQTSSHCWLGPRYDSQNSFGWPGALDPGPCL